MSLVKETFSTMHRWFQPDRAQGTCAVTQWDVVGEGGGTWQVTIKDGTCTVKEGTEVKPDVRMEISARDWLQMLGGRHSAQSLFMAGKLSIDGDITLALKMANVFKPDR
jgi:putative sterol carrier protein